MTDHSQQIVQKLWNCCNVLRDDGMSYGDYPSARLRTGSSAKLRTGVEQLTYLLFLKMADERTKPPCNEPSEEMGPAT
jgi:type I restriction enzyme M protein